MDFLKLEIKFIQVELDFRREIDFLRGIYVISSKGLDYLKVLDQYIYQYFLKYSFWILKGGKNEEFSLGILG